MLTLKQVHLSFPDKVLYKELDWTIKAGQRIGLVGDNGTGKTTLLRLLTGRVEPERGEVQKPGRLRIGYLEQDFSFSTDRPLVDAVVEAVADLSEIEAEMDELRQSLGALDPESEEAAECLRRLGHLQEHFDNVDGYRLRGEASRLLGGLGFQREDYDRPLSAFSGGWQMRAALARLLLSAPDLLLLDEPTNHLDSDTMEWLERYLRSYTGTLIVVSHDRFFLDRTVTQIAELDRGELRIWVGSYQDFLRQKEELKERLRSEALRQQERVAELERFVERFRYKASKARQVQSRVKMLEKIERIEVEQETRGIRFHFPPCERSGDVALKMRGLGHAYEKGSPVFSGLDLELKRGERVALVGVNGAGKTTLSRILCGLLDASEGEVQLGHKVELDFYTQDAEEQMLRENTVLEEIGRINSGLDQTALRSLLGSFLFSGDSVHKRVGVLSGGEKSRLAVAGLLLRRSNLLVLDEPTNHLDIKAKDVLQQSLQDFQGTLLVVSHDRWFLDRVVTRVLELREGRLHDYAGNYSDFLRLREERLEKEQAPAVQDAGKEEEPSAEGRPRKREERKKATEEKIRVRRLLREARKQCAELEERIEEREKRLAVLEEQLIDPQVLADGEGLTRLTREYNTHRKKLDALYSEWEKAQQDLSQTLEELGLDEDV